MFRSCSTAPIGGPDGPNGPSSLGLTQCILGKAMPMTFTDPAADRVDDPVADIPRPPLPDGREIELPGRGTTFMREVPGPHADSPTVILLHGWTATADLNWFTCYEPLGRHFRVLSLDHRGHGRGLRTRRVFHLEDCADDAAALAEVCGVKRAVVVGYSMGGPVAMLTWKRHPQLVAGLVLCATAPYFSANRGEKMSFLGLSGLAALSRMTPAPARAWLTEQLYLGRKATQWEPWAIEEAGRHDWRMILEAGRAIGAFSARNWLEDIDVPTSVLVTMRDDIVPVRRQVRLFEGIHGAEAHRIDGGHDAVVAKADQFVPLLHRSIDSVLTRSRSGTPLD